jgi:hypothetical protein
MGFQTSVYKGERGHTNPKGGQKPEPPSVEPPEKPQVFPWDKNKTILEGIAALSQCKSLAELKDQWGDIRGTEHSPSVFWVSQKPEDQDALTREKDGMKTKLK